jgi:predicted phage baseplate assembly protein
LRLSESDGQVHDWTPTRDLSFHGPQDRVFIVDRQKLELRFGDGLTGRLPVPDLGANPNAIVDYYAGGGLAGRVGYNLEWVAVSADNLSAINVVKAEGGEESETLESAHARAAAALNDHNRAVTKTDFESIALTTPGVSLKRAHAAIGYHPYFPCTPVPGAVTVFVVPFAPRNPAGDYDADDEFIAAPVADPGALQSLRARLDQARLAGTEVFALTARYRPVWLQVDITANPRDLAAMRQRVSDQMRDFLDPLIGGEEGMGWPFGEPLRPSELVSAAQSVIVGTVNGVAIRIDGMDHDESCADVAIGPHDLVVLQQVNVQLQRSTAPAGGLR